ncbi:MAG: ATP-binding protein [Treponema sp.]|nr:ATP-binding protein [Treponema sp.]
MNFSAIKNKLFHEDTESKNNIPFKDMCILDHIEKIVEISKKYGIARCLGKGKGHLDYVSIKLEISPLQALLFSLFMEKCNDSNILISEIAESLKCSQIRIIKYMNDCEELEKKKLIRCSRGYSGVSYRIPRDVWNSLRKNNGYILEKHEDLSLFKLFDVLQTIFEERNNNELTYNNMTMEIQDLINQNMHLEFCKKVMSYQLSTDDFILFICFCHLFGNHDYDNIGTHDIDFLYENNLSFSEIKQSLSDGTHCLMVEKYIEYANNNGLVNSGSWKLSEIRKKELMSDLKGKKNYKKSIILSDTIKARKMYYNPRETAEIQKLTFLLAEENYCKIQNRLDNKGMRKGFACLFSGSPGTGKTETAYQIARETKRDIMMVDISKTKICFLGESEKMIKEIFDTYKTAVEKSEIAPILLFNEADAVIGKRSEINNFNSSIIETNNRIQNIILQEMENLTGILIATTNLTQNMDKAFERRFLYKISFDKPSQESRMGIWNSLMPGLAQETVKDLSSRFELSGGQIENIARKTEVDDILNDMGFSMDTLMQYCKAETQNDFNINKRIGF